MYIKNEKLMALNSQKMFHKQLKNHYLQWPNIQLHIYLCLQFKILPRNV